MYFFKLDTSKEARVTAPVLCNTQFDRTGGVRDFLPETISAFSGMTLKDLQQTAWLGHTDGRGKLGDFDTPSYLNKFNHDFNLIFDRESKKQVRDLYLIGCEAGLSKPGQTVMAQQIADGLGRCGFVNVRVHALSGIGQLDQSMVVRVVTKPQLPLKLTGDVEAWMLNSELTKRWNDLQECIPTYQSWIADPRKSMAEKRDARENLDAAESNLKALEQQATCVMHTSYLQAELNRPHNTFIPSRPEQRPIKQLGQEKMLLMLEQALRQQAYVAGNRRACIFGRLFSSKRQERATLQTLKNLRDKVAVHTGADWLKIINQHKMTFKTSSPIRQLLDQICIQASAESATQTTSVVELRRALTAPFRAATQLFSQPDMPPLMRYAKSAIDLRLKELKRECDTAWFGASALKIYKKEQMERLSDLLNKKWNERKGEVSDWLPLIEAALHDDRLVQGFLRHYTYDTLKEVVDKTRVMHERQLHLQNGSR